jgi:hypothetical protein
VREHGTIEDILKARLKMAVEVRQREHALVLLQHHVAVTLQCDLVHRQRSRFVGAEHVHCPQVLDRVESLDDDLLAPHRHGPFGQADGHDHRQHFGRQTYSHR